MRNLTETNKCLGRALRPGGSCHGPQRGRLRPGTACVCVDEDDEARAFLVGLVEMNETCQDEQELI